MASGIYTTRRALEVADTLTQDTDREELVAALRYLAQDTRKLTAALHAHRGVIVAVAEDKGDEMVDRLEQAWPTT